MGLPSRSHITILPLIEAERLDAVCDRFEAVCLSGLRPRIGDYLEGVEEPARTALARELILLDLHYRHHRAEVPRVTDYDSVNPDLDSNWLAAAVAALNEGSALPLLPGYEILGELGRGGMGVVYKAQEHQLGRLVALKVLHGSRCRDVKALERFRREARAAALLHHTNIVPVFGVGVHEDVHYYAMQYIHGQSLDRVLHEIVRLRREPGAEKTIVQVMPDNISASLASGLLTHRFRMQPVQADATAAMPAPMAWTGTPSRAARSWTDAEIPPADGSSSISSLLGPMEAHYYRNVARLGAQVAEVLAYAHAHGVLHRDIKPANLLLDLQGTIWVTDFGLAKAEGTNELTNPGDVVGTLRYMAPERFQGKADPRSDVYSLGVTLYEMLTLKPAFTARHRVQLINQIVHVEPARPRNLDPQIPRDLETIVLKAIAKNPSDRFSNADEMAKELGRIVDGRPIRSRRVSVLERLWRWSRRNPATAMLGLLAAMLTTLLAIGSTAAAWKFREQRNEVIRKDRATQEKLGESLLLQARGVRISKQPGRRAEGLEILSQAAGLTRAGIGSPEHVKKLRNEVIATLAEVDERPVHTWPGLNLEEEKSAFSFDADRYVVLEEGRSFHLHRFSDQAEIRVVKASGAQALSWPVLDASGRFVTVWSGSSRTELWDLERGAIPATWPADVKCASLRFDGRQVAALRPDGEVRLYDLPAMKEASRCRIGLEFPMRLGHQHMALSRDGGYLAVMRPEGRDAWVCELSTGRQVIHVSVPEVYYGSLALSRKGELLAVAHDQVISVFDVRTGERLSMLQEHRASGVVVFFEPENDLLISPCWDGLLRVWDPVRGRLLSAFPGSLRSRNGKRWTFVVGWLKDLIHYELKDSQERSTIDCRKLGNQADFRLYGPAKAAFSPDGSMIAMAFRPDGVRIVRASDRLHLAQLPIGNCDEVLYLPDGSLVTYSGHGVCRWPARRVADHGLQLGPPQPLAYVAPSLGYFGQGLAAGGNRWLVGASFWPAGSVLVDPADPLGPVWLMPHRKVIEIAISPDGKWAATAGMEGYPGKARVKVWDAATGRLVKEISGFSCAAFSPDGQLLGTNDKTSYHFFRTGSWTQVSRFDFNIDLRADVGVMRIAFHPAGRIAAVLDPEASGIYLVELHSGRDFALLNVTDAAQAQWLSFSPNGRYLMASRNDQKVDLWDLGLIRRRLEDFGLAAGIPDLFGPNTSIAETPAVKRIEVRGANPAGFRLLAARQTLRELGIAIRERSGPRLTDPDGLQNRAVFRSRLGLWKLAAADYRAALAKKPDSALTANNLAWCLASVPGRGDPEEACYWAQRAVALEPTVTNRNTLGTVLYRAGRFAEAVAELEKNVVANSSYLGYDCLVLAMCRQRLGQAESARAALARAKEWRAANGLTDPLGVGEFQALLQEAETVVTGSLPDFPASLFAP
jgi:serine/threonine protein kinase/WD40 repeat protein